MAWHIVASEPQHVNMLVAGLRENDAREITCAGYRVKRAIWQSYRTSLLRRSAFVDGEIAAMWGIGAAPLDRSGRPWLMTTGAIEKLPLTYLKQARREVREMLDCYPVLYNWVHADYTAAVRFLRMLGFTLEKAAPWGPTGAMFHRFEMRA